MWRRFWRWLVARPAEALLRHAERIEALEQVQVICIHSRTHDRCETCEAIYQSVNR